MINVNKWIGDLGKVKITEKRSQPASGRSWVRLPLGTQENSLSGYFDLEALLRYLYFIQVTNPFLIYFLLFMEQI